MTFKSDAHRRWWFANRGNAGGGGGPANFSSRDLKREKDWEMVQENGRWVEKDPVVRALVEENDRRDHAQEDEWEMVEIDGQWVLKDPVLRAQEAEIARREEEDAHYERQAAYWRGEG